MLKTVRQIVESMGDKYEVNHIDDAAGLPGVLIGRYPGDEYSGVIMNPSNATPICQGYNCGNPWFMTTHTLAEHLFTLAGEITRFRVDDFSNDLFDFLRWAWDLALPRDERGKE